MRRAIDSPSAATTFVSWTVNGPTSSPARTDSAGFLFVDETTHLVGAVGAAGRADLDLKVERRADGTLWLTPGRASVTWDLRGAHGTPAAPGVYLVRLTAASRSITRRVVVL